jgi:subtilisin family serine protease
MREAIERLDELGVVVVAAAGNEGHAQLDYPAAFPSVIAVGAARKLAPTERVEWSNHGEGLDLIAPGDELLVGCYGNLNAVSEAQVCGASGTSFAAPIVAGTAALLLAQDPTRTPEDVRERLRATAYLDPSASAFEVGAGLLRIDGALGLPAPTSDHDRTLTLELGDGERTVALPTDQLTGVGVEVDASALLAAGHVSLRIEHEERAFRADFALPLALVRQPPERP